MPNILVVTKCDTRNRETAIYAIHATPITGDTIAQQHKANRSVFPEKFGLAYPMLNCSADMLLYFATKTHSVAARIENGKIVIFAPFGLDDLFSFRLTPNPVLSNRATHESKAARAMALWPELQFEPWPD